MLLGMRGGLEQLLWLTGSHMFPPQSALALQCALLSPVCPPAPAFLSYTGMNIGSFSVGGVASLATGSRLTVNQVVDVEMPWQLLTVHDSGAIQASPAGRLAVPSGS